MTKNLHSQKVHLDTDDGINLGVVRTTRMVRAVHMAVKHENSRKAPVFEWRGTVSFKGADVDVCAFANTSFRPPEDVVWRSVGFVQENTND